MSHPQLEDDIITKPGYLTTMKSFVTNQKTTDWILLEFSQLGFIGELFVLSQSFTLGSYRHLKTLKVPEFNDGRIKPLNMFYFNSMNVILGLCHSYSGKVVTFQESLFACKCKLSKTSRLLRRAATGICPDLLGWVTARLTTAITCDTDR